MRIIGYDDPRKLNEIDEWNELKNYHHFCISQTLVQGLSREFGRTEFKVLTTVDKLIKKFYREWSDNKERDVKHFLDIRRYIQEIKDLKLKKAFMENKLEVYNSVKFLIECELSTDQLNLENLTDEKKVFFDIYKKVETNIDWAEFKELDSKTIYSLKESIKEIVIDEINSEISEKNNIVIEEIDFTKLVDCDKEKYLDDIINKLNHQIKTLSNENMDRSKKILKKRLENYKDILSNYENEKIEKVIFHGIHQFTPIILKLIKYLEKNNIEVIFLINYNNEFNRIYSTWDKVYKWTGCKIEKKITGYKYDQLKIAKNYASIVEGNFEDISEDNDGISITKFDNYTEMAHYIADKYEEAKQSIKEDFSPTKILAKMEEQFYSVDGTNINNILKVYFPEQFEQKHFLAYPVGQLILAIYNLWDESKNQIIIKEEVIKECLSTNIWARNKDNIKYTPLEIFEYIKVYFEDLEECSIERYLERIKILIEKIQVIDGLKPENRKRDYKKLGFYNLSLNEILYFESIILEIKKLIEILMGDGREVNMINHYKTLLTLISKRINDDDNFKKEVSFVKEIEERIKKLDGSTNESIGAIKETLHFYLAQNKDGNTSNWIVRDFNQIDGGILLADPNAKERKFKEKISTYHFMEVSDSDMQGKKKVSLSWPLDESIFINNNNILEVINLCKSEYKNYLRFTLFYALFYVGEIDIKISYIENKEENFKEQLYYVLRMLNLKENVVLNNENLNFKSKNSINSENTIISDNTIRELDVINYNFCEDRFLYESIIEGNGSYKNNFLIKQYLKNFIAISVYEKRNRTNIKAGIKSVIPYANESLLNDLEFSISQKVKYLEESCKKYGGVDLNYKEIIKDFILAKFSKDDLTELLTEYKISEKSLKEIKQYLKGGKYIGKKDIEEKCLYCKYRQICVGQRQG
ncbi:hypothetical protein [Clostridium sp. HCS.1]|uniref:hypothetical protein n=1 Tax=Clostridium sp. HCS.1 TaxID=3238594 RepID=UPI003A0FFF1E